MDEELLFHILMIVDVDCQLGFSHTCHLHYLQCNIFMQALNNNLQL